MNSIVPVFLNEVHCFFNNDKTTYFTYIILVIVWSILISTNIMHSEIDSQNILWLIFFSVIVSGNFSIQTFVSERVSGSLEILLTSGFSRATIVNGKIVFIMTMSVFLGILCYTIGFIFSIAANEALFKFIELRYRYHLLNLLIYSAACFMNVACGAWFSCQVKNPRLLHFLTLFIVAIIVVLHKLLEYIFGIPFLSLFYALLILGAIFYVLTIKAFHSEKVVTPVVY